MTDVIAEFAQRHGIDAPAIHAIIADACGDAPAWPRVLGLLAERRINLSPEDRKALHDAVGEALRNRPTREPARAAPEAPAPDPTPEPAPTAEAAVERVRAILSAPEAKGRESAAHHLALNTPLSAAEAVAMLRTMPTAARAPAAATMPAPAPRNQTGDAKPTEALVAVRPDPPGHNPYAKDRRASAAETWGKAIQRMAPSGA